MVSPDIGPSLSATPHEEKRNWLPMVMGGGAVLLIIAAAILLSGRNETQPQAQVDTRVAVSGLHMATAQNFAGGTVTYIEGQIKNGTDQKLTSARVEVRFKNSLGQTAQKDVLPVTVLLPNVPYVDYGTLDRAPLSSGQTRDFRITLEHVTADWDGQVPAIRVVSIGK